MGLYVLALVIAAGLLAVIWQLDKLNAQLQAIAHQVGNRDADAVHDATHPVFSVQQLVRTRQQFERDYKRQLQRETELFNSSDWRSRASAGVSASLRERLRANCEALVQSESTWKKYVWMVEGNLAVAGGRQSRTAIMQGFSDLLMRTRGTAELTVAPNTEKVQRVEEILTNWIARLTGTTTATVAIDMPDTAEESFDVAVEEEQKSRAQMRN